MNKEELTTLIHNFNTDCHKQYTKVSPHLGHLLDESLQDIEKFYYSDFWIKRFKRRLQEEGISYNPIQLDIIQGTTSELKENTKFELFDESTKSKGVSNTGEMIALNVNIKNDELNDSHINTTIMHEFGHRQYNQDEFQLIVELNQKTMGVIGDNIKEKESLSEKDYKYFIDHNELRQRLIPIIKEMRDNNWTIGETYDLSYNLEIDDIKDIFTREYILKLLDNLL